jgi:hypothetical protein
LAAEAESAVAQAGGAEEVAEVGGAVGAVQVAHDDPRASGFCHAVSERGELSISGTARSPLVDRGDGVGQPDLTRPNADQDRGVREWPEADSQRFGRIDLQRPVAEPEGQSHGAEGGIDPIGKLPAHADEPGAPGAAVFDQANDVRLLALDEPFEGLILRVIALDVGDEDPEAIGSRGIRAHRVGDIEPNPGAELVESHRTQHDRQLAPGPDRGTDRQRDQRCQLLEMRQQIGSPVRAAQELGQWMHERCQDQDGCEADPEPPSQPAAGRTRFRVWLGSILDGLTRHHTEVLVTSSTYFLADPSSLFEST